MAPTAPGGQEQTAKVRRIEEICTPLQPFVAIVFLPPDEESTRFYPMPTMTTDQKKERFLQLIEPVHENLARFARSLVQNDEEGRDLVAATLLRAFEKFDTLREEKAFLSWLFTIALRLARNPRRYQERYTLQSPETGDLQESRMPPPDLQHDIELLRRAIDRLPAREREAVLLFEIGGLPISEIRDIQGGTISGVKSRISRGRKKIGKALGVEMESPAGASSPGTNRQQRDPDEEMLRVYTTVSS